MKIRESAGLFENKNIRYFLYLCIFFAVSIIIGSLSAMMPAVYIIAFGLAGIIFFLGIQKPIWLVYFIILSGWFPLELLTRGQKNLFVFLGGINIAGLRLFAVVLILLLFVLSHKETIVWFNKFKLYLLFLLFVGFSLLYSPGRLDGLRFLFKVTFPLLLCVTILTVVKDRKDLERLIKIFICSGILGSLFGFIMILSRDIFPTDVAKFAVSKYYGWAGWATFAFFIGTVSLLCYALFIHQRKILYLSFSFFFLFEIVIGLVRIAIGGIFVSFAALEWLRGNKKRIVLLGLICLLVFLTVTPVQRRMFSGETIQLSDIVEGKLLKYISKIHLSGRDKFWGWMLSRISWRNIIQGEGAGAYAWLIREIIRMPYLPHGEYVRLLYECGVIGLFLFLLAFFNIGKMVFDEYKKANDKTTQALSLAAFGAIVYYLIAAMTDNALEYYAFFSGYVWALIAFVLKASYLYKQEEEETSRIT